jgi:uncharacterized protein YndB with AHSA1/START domain
MMSEIATAFTLAGDRELTIERVFDAPRELVFKAFTEPERLKQWWGTREYKTDVCNLDLRVGGVWHYRMSSSAGEASWGRAVYEEITAPERLVYVDAFSDENGSVIPPKMHITVEFIDQDGKTLLRSTTRFEREADRDALIDMGVQQGISETWDQLAEYLAAQR